MRGDVIPVSKLMAGADGTLPQGTAAFEKLRHCSFCSQASSDCCIQCNICSLYLPPLLHRPIVRDADEVLAAPKNIKMHDMRGKGL